MLGSVVKSVQFEMSEEYLHNTTWNESLPPESFSNAQIVLACTFLVGIYQLVFGLYSPAFLLNLDNLDSLRSTSTRLRLDLHVGAILERLHLFSSISCSLLAN